MVSLHYTFHIVIVIAITTWQFVMLVALFRMTLSKHADSSCSCTHTYVKLIAMSTVSSFHKYDLSWCKRAAIGISPLKLGMLILKYPLNVIIALLDRISNPGSLFQCFPAASLNVLFMENHTWILDFRSLSASQPNMGLMKHAAAQSLFMFIQK